MPLVSKRETRPGRRENAADSRPHGGAISQQLSDLPSPGGGPPVRPARGDLRRSAATRRAEAADPAAAFT